MRAAIFDGENELHSLIPERERNILRNLDMKSRGTLLHHEYNQFFRSFVKHTLPKDDLYDVVRAFDTADDMVVLKRLLLIANSDGKWAWGSFCRTLLFYAANDENECLVVMLLDVGVDVNASARRIPPHQNNLNAIQIAVHSGKRKIIETLESRGATIFTGDRYEDFTFLSDASTRGTMDFAKSLLTKAATSDVRTARNGTKVLILAVERSHDTIVDVLLETGFNPYSNFHEEPSPLRECAFMAALRMTKTKYLEKFLEIPCHHFDSDQRQERLRQLTAGYVSACCFEDLDLKNAILNTGWNPDEVKGVMGYDFVQVYLYDALAVAVKRGDCDRVRCLTRIGASPNCPPDMILGWNVMTLLQWAMERGTMFMVRQLIAAGADVNLLSSRVHESPLQYAVSTWNLVLAKLLVEAGANVNLCPRRWSRSAIEIAAGSGQIEMVTYLVESGADIQGRHNRNYRRTLYRAKMAGYDSVVKLLQQWKKPKFGEQDCDTIDNIMETMTLDELEFPSEEARIDYLERGQSDTESTMDFTDEE
ncbi:uncharacterized protein J4E84_004964 [Alternaria hordeiaustralica]|uniref:uncharacterized protein n=1 Tax=Alternaria hordeiaustralica TaxID=1187925 RepID=UPI0020C27BEB|nr:uncharacterized protein J4E84_004964 [Alternaria hordeiaustralica]KAI4688036.1 hypothetical protein J4E84_004964 [Alternaria hordeiaustralica]